MEDRDGGRGPREPHALGLPDREPGRQWGREPRQREPARVDGDRPGLRQQLTRLRLEMEALEPLREQEDEKWLVHRGRTL
jgi:hypothetical protein